MYGTAGGGRRGGDPGGGFGRTARWEFQAKENGHVSQRPWAPAVGPSTAAPALGQRQRGAAPARGQQGGAGPCGRFYLGAPNLLRGSDFQEGLGGNSAAVTTEA